MKEQCDLGSFEFDFNGSVEGFLSLCLTWWSMVGGWTLPDLVVNCERVDLVEFLGDC